MKAYIKKLLFIIFSILYAMSSLFRAPVAYAASATIVADGDITTTNWTSGTCAINLWDCINEGTVSYNDLDYIETPVGALNYDYVFTSSSSPSDLETVTAFTINVRAERIGNKTTTLDVYYSTDGSDPSTQVGSQATLTATAAEYTFTASGLSLTKTQIDALRIKFRANSGNNTSVRVTASQTDITYDPVPTPTPTSTPTPTPTPTPVGPNPSSENFELEEYGFGSGGTDSNMSSTNFKMFGTLGEVESGRLFSANYKAGSGLIFTLKLHVPPAPALSNPATNYDRLKFVLNEGGNKSDVTYAVAISTDNFASDIRYIKSDLTVGSTLTTSDFKTYTNWGGATGAFVTMLANDTTYYIRAKARIGNFTETEWGPASTGVSTSNSSLTLTLDKSSIIFNGLNAGDSYTDSTQSTLMTTSTNAYNGYAIYGKENQPLKTPDNFTISNYAGTNAVPTSWTGTGFGYTTNDSNLGGTGGVNRFANGTKYAGFTTNEQKIVADNPGPVQDPAIFEEKFIVSYRVTVDATTPAGTYSNVILYTIVPTF